MCVQVSGFVGFVVHTFTIELLEEKVCNCLGLLIFSVLKLQIVPRIFLLDSVLGAPFVWVTSCHIEME